MSPKHILQLFDKLVLPILNYGGEVLGFAQATQIERTHLQFCKRLLGVKISTQNDFIYGELGRTTLHTQRLVNIIKYWLRIMNMPERKYVKIIYSMMLDDINVRPNKPNWASLVRNLLNELGFGFAWIAQGVGDTDQFMNIIRQRLHDNFVQCWSHRLNESTRALFYRSICTFEYQLYLDNITVRKFRVSLTKLRVSSHRLEIEAGRWHKPVSKPFDQRKCMICNVLEDEFHFLMICPMYTELRRIYIHSFYLKKPSMFKLVELVSSSN